MDGSSISLRYELTFADLTLQQIRRPKFRRLVIAWCLISAVLGIGVHRWWLTVIYLALGLEAWLSFPVLDELVRSANRLLPSKRFLVQLDSDDKGIRVRYRAQEKASPIRYWWSRLSGVRQDRFGVMLLFDKGWVGLPIPSAAFPSTEVLDHFLDLARQHLQHTPATAAR